MSDIYALAVGGARVSEPAADLGIALAVASSVAGVPVAADLVVVGEVGLGGEVRQVSQIDRRLNEAARLGFARAVVPRLAPEPPAGFGVERVGTLAEAVELLGLRAARGPARGR
jgi:DNA repair protein RadA/Sms